MVMDRMRGRSQVTTLDDDDDDDGLTPLESCMYLSREHYAQSSELHARAAHARALLHFFSRKAHKRNYPAGLVVLLLCDITNKN